MAEETDDQCHLVGFNTQELRMVSGQLEEQLTGQRHLAGHEKRLRKFGRRFRHF
jgi:hypothetical protein